jgi:hypothetical protein
MMPIFEDDMTVTSDKGNARLAKIAAINPAVPEPTIAMGSGF